MKKTNLIIAIVVVIVAVIGIFWFTTKKSDESTVKTNDNNVVKTEETNNVAEENTANTEDKELKEEKIEKSPVPYGETDFDLISAKDNGATYYTFEEGTGTCMDKGFPTNLIYDTKNEVRTMDGSYADKWTGITFTGLLTFTKVPLSDGTEVDCSVNTGVSGDYVDMTCTKDDADYCTAKFKLMVHFDELK